MEKSGKINIIVTRSPQMSDRVKTSRKNFAALMATLLIEQARKSRQSKPEGESGKD